MNGLMSDFGFEEIPDQPPQKPESLSVHTDFRTPARLLSADPQTDPVVGQDELGRNIYRSPLGQRYIVDDIPRPDSLSEAAKKAIDAIPPIEDWRLPTKDEMVSGAKALGKGIIEGAQHIIETPTNPDATLGDVFNVGVGMAAPGSSKILDTLDPTTVKMFFGPNSPKADLHALENAKNLKDLGTFSDEEIWQRTGWWKSPNGWRYEVSDHDMELWPDVEEDLFLGTNVSGSLGDIILHPQYAENIPRFGEVSTLVARVPETAGSAGSFEKTRGIYAGAASIDNLKSVLLHEMQHLEQQTNDLVGKGASPTYMFVQIDNALNQLPRDALEYLVAQKQIQTDIANLSLWRSSLQEETPKGWGVVGEDDLEDAVEGFTEKITELKRQRNQLNTVFTAAYGEDFKKSLDKFNEFVKDYPVLQLGDEGIPYRNPSVVKRAKAAQDASFDLYQREVGEAEARATQKRQNLNKFERSIRLPSKDYDKPLEDLFSVYDLSNILNNLLSDWDNIKSKRRQYAEGGMVEQPALDPISNNPVPAGAKPKEVRDDVPIMASEGEYVIPANVVRYLGLDKIEKMIEQAKKGLAELEARGRIGGEGEDNLPFKPEELQTVELENTPQRMSTGGLVSSDNTDIDPQTGLPKWLVSLQGGTPQVAPPAVTPPVVSTQSPTNMQSERNERPDRVVGGLSGSVKEWTPKEFEQYSRARDSVGHRAIQGFVNTSLPFGGIATRAVQRHLEERVPEEIDRMLSTGKDMQGNRLTPEQVKSLETAKERISSNPIGRATGFRAVGVKAAEDAGLISRRAPAEEKRFRDTAVGRAIGSLIGRRDPSKTETKDRTSSGSSSRGSGSDRDAPSNRREAAQDETKRDLR